jgi:hypothetical protein
MIPRWIHRGVLYLNRGVRYAWPGLYTVVGLWAFIVPWQGSRRWIAHRGTIGIVGPAIERLLALAPIQGGASALTLGHTILAASEEAFFATWDHEFVHVRQYERWGPLFVPAYFICGWWQWMHGHHPYWDNPFEVEARRG